jgi:methionyl-tRNA synthetase
MGQIWTPENQVFLYVLLAWTLVWKGFAMWRAGKRNEKAWFVVFLIVNLLGIPEIVYLLVTKKGSVCCATEEKKEEVK